MVPDFVNLTQDLATSGLCVGIYTFLAPRTRRRATGLAVALVCVWAPMLLLFLLGVEKRHQVACWLDGDRAGSKTAFIQVRAYRTARHV